MRLTAPKAGANDETAATGDRPNQEKKTKSDSASTRPADAETAAMIQRRITTFCSGQPMASR